MSTGLTVPNYSMNAALAPSDVCRADPRPTKCDCGISVDEGLGAVMIGVLAKLRHIF